MNRQMLADLEQAIERVINDHCENAEWDGLIHPHLTRQMADAAALIFDATMDGQDFAERERGKDGK